MGIRIDGAGALNVERVESTVTSDDFGLTLDLCRCGFVEPYALVLMSCALDDAIANGSPVSWVTPKAAGVSRYLSRVGFGARLESVGIEDHGLHHDSETDVSDRMIELTAVDSSAPVTGLCDLVTTALDLPMPLFSNVWESMSEMGNNLLEHSGVKRGWLSAQLVGWGTSSREMLWAMGDAGIGVRASLNGSTVTAHDFADDATAVTEALIEGVTSKEQGRGVGLHFASEVAGGLDGHFVLRSGSARVHVTREGRQLSTVEHINGTIVAGRFKVKT